MSNIEKSHVIEPLRERLYYVSLRILNYFDSRIILFPEEKLNDPDQYYGEGNKVSYINQYGRFMRFTEDEAYENLFTLSDFTYSEAIRRSCYEAVILRILVWDRPKDESVHALISRAIKELVHVGLTTAPQFQEEITDFACNYIKDFRSHGEKEEEKEEEEGNEGKKQV